MTLTSHTNIHILSALRFVALALSTIILAACSLSPLGQADAPTDPPTTTSAQATRGIPTQGGAPATNAPVATPAPPEPTVALSSEKPSGERPAAAQQLTEISGKFTYTNDIITTYYVEHAAALVDMYGFVQRDKEWEVPINSQVLGYMKLDAEAKNGDYLIQLPQLPRAQFVDVNHDGKQDLGV